MYPHAHRSQHEDRYYTGAICGYYTKSLSGYASSWRGSIWTPDPKDPRKYRQVDLPILIGPDPTFKGTTALPFGVQPGGAGRRLRAPTR